MTQSWWQWLRGWWNIGTFGGSFSALRTKSQKSNARCTMRNEQDSNFHLGRTDADATWAVKNRDFFRIWAHTWVKVGNSLIINMCGEVFGMSRDGMSSNEVDLGEVAVDSANIYFCA